MNAQPHASPFAAAAAPTAAANPVAKQLLCFRLAEQLYGLDILAVKEIRRFSTPTALPDVPSYVLGVINLRGAVVPVFDLRLRFNVGSPDTDRNTAIIVVTVGTRNIGVVVDAVTRVLDVRADMLRPTPPLGGGVDASFLLGLVAVNEQLVTWLDVSRLLGNDLEAT